MPILSHEVRASYYDWARRGQVFIAYATVTSPTIWSTAAGTGGPLLWNNSGPVTATSTTTAPKAVNAVLLGLGVGITTASGAASALGITGGISVAPTSTTAIDGSGNLNTGSGITAACNTYRKGTVATAGAWFMPTHGIGTGAVTLSSISPQWVDLGGSIVVPPGSWASVAASATATSAVLDIALIWAEIPL